MPLDPELAAYLESQKNQPPRSSLTIAQTREVLRNAARLGGDPPADVHAFDRRLNGTIPSRVYEPPGLLPDAAMVYFHGGRFISGDLDSHDILCRRLASESGCRLIAIDYRLAPEHPYPAAVDDAIAATTAIAREYTKVVVAGDSAGANLAAVAAMHATAKLRGQILIYPMIDALCRLDSHREFATGFGPGSNDMRRGWREYVGHSNPRDPLISPIYAADLRQMPPAFLLTAEYDCLRDEGELFARRLREAGREVTLRRYEGAIHGFITLTGIAEMARRAVNELAHVARSLLL